jgi:hypothetical protein
MIILAIAVIGFFATGGIGKIKKAKEIARSDFLILKEKTTSFVDDIKKTNDAKGKDIPTEINQNDFNESVGRGF